MPAHISAAEIIAKAINRDPEAFATLYRESSPRVFRHVLYLVGSRQVADDLTSETFLRAWRAIDRYEDRGLPFESWLLRIAHNLAVHQLKRIRSTVPVDGLALLDDDERSPESAVESQATAKEIRGAILQLPDLERQVIVWRFLEGMGYDEIAALIDKRKANIRVIQCRALRRLRSLLLEPTSATCAEGKAKVLAIGVA